MWCPDGFVTFRDLVYTCVRLGQRYANTLASKDGINLELLSLAYGEYVSDNENGPPAAWALAAERELTLAAAEYFSIWLADSAITCFDAFICSPTGQLLKIESDAISHEHELGLVRWKSIQIPWVIAKLCFDQVVMKSQDSAWDDFRVFQYPSGIIRGYTQVPGEIELSESRIITTQNFKDWAICFKRDDIPEDENKLLEELDFDPSCLWNEESESDSDAKGRLAYTWNCLQQAFPDGKGRATWAEVEKVTGFSRRNINRALEAHQAKSWAKYVGK